MRINIQRIYTDIQIYTEIYKRINTYVLTIQITLYLYVYNIYIYI